MTKYSRQDFRDRSFRDTALPRPVDPARGFARNEDGSLIIFSLFIFVLMLIIAGISLDIERFETARTKLQNTADSAALAAASLSQEVTSQEIVDSYFAVQGMAPFFENLTVDEDTGFKRVQVNADIHVPTHFFNMIGVENLGTIVSSIAEESVGNVEISLVLDISGSMGSNNKLDNLKAAAGDFMDTIYADVTPGTVSISVVPYSTQVSAGPEVLAYFNNLTGFPHDNSHCLDLKNDVFDSTALDPATAVEQTAHFDARTRETWGWDVGDGLWYIECPTMEWTDILLFQEDPQALKDYINAFNATFWTSIELGVKWGAALLDPAFRPVVGGMSAAGDIPVDFSARPNAFDDTDNMKVLVVMTDGINTSQYELVHPYPNEDSYVYRWDDPLGRSYYSVWNHSNQPPQIPANGATQWYVANNFAGDGVALGWATAPIGGVAATRLTWNELYEEIPLEVFADDWLAQMGWNSEQSKIKASRMGSARAVKDNRTRRICTAAKDQGIVIYTVSFEAPAAAADLLRECATSPSHAFNVSGTDISNAFAAIASSINQLRLVQ